MISKNKDLITSYGVKKIGLFGSFFKNTQTPKSDIDVLVEFGSEKFNYNNFVNLTWFLEDNPGTEIELVTLDSLSTSCRLEHPRIN
ncbi:nucleotidyltransferase domain-containing protein [Marispirochaeta aestuarii]|uniref:nucleotidyltransferase family protein n=1 Tax=Marispirochaeta aestuarii TaxID=1963862 RepID=UPI0029C839EB|nr:nucleotidyltransferase domain-containing protein [Marispirochaeta aestuarii]